MSQSTESPFFKTIFEDNHVLVISKPAGLLSQGDDSGHANLVDILREIWGRPYVGLVHRLDRNTSGLMVVAKRSKSAERLTESLQSGQLVRHYEAVLSGDLSRLESSGKKFNWQDLLLKNPKTNLVEVVLADTPGAKMARLEGQLLKVAQFKTQAFTLVRFELETGRSHQIRVQAASRGFPLVGDVKYGFRPSFFEGPTKNSPRTCLHSCFLRFPHPVGDRPLLEFKDEIPEDMKVYFG
jgi:23S rRNA pseudouridine1911/1915/1917 synthase